ncbi:MAG: type I DNA topoisomerase, partial [Bacilli bacterium]|nr:type I DNA topoisomerase [Bacilli bacterium]
MKLVIVESPHKATTIGRYLGPEYQVKASKGHVRDLSSHGSGGLGISIDKGFQPIWEVPEDKLKIVEELRKAAEKADEVILATDPDREGEAISWHLAQLLNLDLATTKRLQFHEITEPAIKEALANPGHIDLNLVDSQLTRRMYDRIIGFKLSGLLSRKIFAKSAGRVQSPTLKMIVDNDKAVAHWVPENYWTVNVTLSVDGKEVPATLIDKKGKTVEFKSEDEAKAALAKIPQTLRVFGVKKSAKTAMPKEPFTTSTLQQEASRLYHMSPTKTMEAAQKLYEGVKVGDQTIGLITYMRTDSTRLSDRFYNVHAVPFIKEKFGDSFVGTLRAPKKSAHAQDAHEAIRPTGTHRTPSYVAPYLTKEQANIYRLIYSRALSSVMKPKQYEQTEVTFEGNGMQFLSKGSRTIFPGFEVVYKEFEEEEDPKTLPLMNEGQELPLKEKGEKKNTKPGPTPYSEGRVVRLMEEEGVGRPSTYASTIKTLLDHNYATRKSGTVVATEEGIHVTEAMEKYFPEIVSAKYTADMEKTLDDIDNGDLKWLDAMNAFYGPFMEKFAEVSK